MKKASLLVLMVLLIFFNSCQENETEPKCVDLEPKPIAMDEFPLAAKLLNIDPDLPAVHLTIDNLVDYDHYIETDPGFPRPIIDFKKQMILTGRVNDSECGYLLRADLDGNCSAYLLTLVIKTMDCNAETKIVYFKLIDKTEAEISYAITYE